MKKFLSVLLVYALFFVMILPIYAENGDKTEAENETDEKELPFSVEAKSAVLMEAETGEILYAFCENEPLPPASVTKIMTLLLTMEAIEAGKIAPDDAVSISAYAASMGGSQVFLEEGESITLADLIKCCVIASANDAAVALGELVSGSEEAFVADMNRRGEELGLQNTRFENATGLDDTVERHVMSAYDIAQISRALLRYPMITEYASIWQDTIRNGNFTLTNTNRLVRFYDGCNGLKTGSTDRAGFCMSAAAKRDGMQLIAVVMGAPTRDKRNAIAKKLLDYGFSQYALYASEEAFLEQVPVYGGVRDAVALWERPFFALVGRGKAGSVEERYAIPEAVCAPLRVGQIVGTVSFYSDGEKIGESAIEVREDVARITFVELFWRMIAFTAGIGV